MIRSFPRTPTSHGFPQLMRARSGHRKSMLLFVAFVRPRLPKAEIIVNNVTYLPQGRKHTTNIAYHEHSNALQWSRSRRRVVWGSLRRKVVHRSYQLMIALSEIDQSRARPDAGRLGTRRPTGLWQRQHCRASSASRDRASRTVSGLLRQARQLLRHLRRRT